MAKLALVVGWDEIGKVAIAPEGWRLGAALLAEACGLVGLDVDGERLRGAVETGDPQVALGIAATLSTTATAAHSALVALEGADTELSWPLHVLAEIRTRRAFLCICSFAADQLHLMAWRLVHSTAKAA